MCRNPSRRPPPLTGFTAVQSLTRALPETARDVSKTPVQSVSFLSLSRFRARRSTTVVSDPTRRHHHRLQCLNSFVDLTDEFAVDSVCVFPMAFGCLVWKPECRWRLPRRRPWHAAVPKHRPDDHLSPYARNRLSLHRRLGLDHRVPVHLRCTAQYGPRAPSASAGHVSGSP